MALLSAEEKEELKKQGLWVREKCDVCHRPILSPVTYIKKGQVLCSGCANGYQDSVLKIIKEENVMAKQKTVKNEEKKEGKPSTRKEMIAGCMREGSAAADLYLALKDEKKHSMKELQSLFKKNGHTVDLMNRVYQVGRFGRTKADKTWYLIVDDESVQLKHGKAPKEAPAKAKEAPAKKAKPAPEPNEPVARKKSAEKPEEISSKTLKAAATLVRRALKSGKDWTRNKLTEHLVNKENMDAATVKAALNEEIKAGGVVVDDGVLTLA